MMAFFIGFFLTFLILSALPYFIDGLPYSVRAPPRGILNIYTQSDNDFDLSIFPTFVTTHQPALFSSQFKRFRNKLQGRVMAADPPNACTLKRVPKIPFNLRYDQSWILLADNLDCDLALKIKNAHQAGYSALLIYNTNADYETQIIRLDSNQLEIYTSSIGGMDGYLLRSLYSYPNEYYVEIEENPMLFLDVLYHLMIVCFTITTMFVGLFLATWLYDTLKCQQCMERLQTQNREKSLRRLLKTKTIIRQWTPDGPFLNNDSCIICLEDFSTADQIRVLPCLHVFHTICIDIWMLKMSTTCPICKQCVGARSGELQISGSGQQDSSRTIAEEEAYYYQNGHNLVSMYGQEPYNLGYNESIPLLVQNPNFASPRSQNQSSNNQSQEMVPNSSPGSSITNNAHGNGNNYSIENLRLATHEFCELLPSEVGQHSDQYE